MSIRFLTKFEQLLTFSELQPRRVPPEWFSSISTKINQSNIDKVEKEIEGFRTVRVCPGFTDLYENVIMLPMWSDIRLTRCSIDKNNNPIPDPDANSLYSCEEPSEETTVDWHPASQAPGMPGTFGMNALPKIISPWWIETDKGWSIFITPATHHCRTLPFEPISGIIDTDIYHDGHLPCRWTRVPGSEETIFAGTPFAYIFPFKREEKPEIEIRLVKDKQEIERLDVKFEPGEYRRKRKTS